MSYMDGEGKWMMMARAAVAGGAAVGWVAWISAMVRINPGAAWFWEHESSYELFDALRALFMIGTVSVFAHVVAMSLAFQLKPARGGLWLSQAVLLGASGCAGFAVLGSHPVLSYESPLVIPVVVDAVGVVLTGLAWWVATSRSSRGDRSEPPVLDVAHAGSVIVPLTICLCATGFWADMEFDEGMGPDDGGIVALILLATIVGAVFAQILVAVANRRRHTLAARDSAAAA